jgi:hypothetical protein
MRIFRNKGLVVNDPVFLLKREAAQCPTAIGRIVGDPGESASRFARQPPLIRQQADVGGKTRQTVDNRSLI